MKLFMIRHGQSEANLLGIYAGQLDYPLTQTGREQAMAIRPILAKYPFEKVFSSDLGRAVETQKLALPGWEAEQTPLLREYEEGSLVGQSWKEVAEKYGPIRDNGPFGGESNVQVEARVREFLSGLEDKPWEYVAAFAHNGLMKTMLRVVLKSDLDRNLISSRNCCIAVFEFSGGEWRMISWNYGGAI